MAIAESHNSGLDPSKLDALAAHQQSANMSKPVDILFFMTFFPVHITV
jgi:hypothetical protein